MSLKKNRLNKRRYRYIAYNAKQLTENLYIPQHDLMMKTASGRAFSTLNNKYRVGLMMINDAQPAVEMDTFEGAHRTDWYTTLYGVSTNGGTPLQMF